MSKWIKLFGTECKIEEVTNVKGTEKIKISPLKYSALLVSELKEMEGSKYEGSNVWTVKATPRNRFSLDILCNGEFSKQYKRFTQSVPVWDTSINLVDSIERRMDTGGAHHEVVADGAWNHQITMSNWCLYRRRYINAGEMGTGKTFATLRALRKKVKDGWTGAKWWIGPNSGLTALRTQLYKWGFQDKFFGSANNLFTKGDKIFNYHNLENEMDQATTWPQIVVFDEMHMLKAPTSRRTQLAIQLSIEMEKQWGDECMVIGLTGTPAPEDHNDWWALAEIIRPGFLKESSFQKYKYRIGNYSMVAREPGDERPPYPKFDGWRNHTPIYRCKHCERKLGDVHTYGCPNAHAGLLVKSHSFADYELNPPKVNTSEELIPDTRCTNNKCEVCSILPRRLEGLVLVTWKRDCMDLPEKVYETIELQPDASTIRVAKSLKRMYTGAQLQVHLRELSDGFQYVSVEEGNDGIKAPSKSTTIGHTPKDGALLEILEEHAEGAVPRIVIYAAFTASIDRIVKLCIDNGWQVWRYDGRGSCFFDSKMSVALNEPRQLLTGPQVNMVDETYWQDVRANKQKIAFVGNPEAAGQGLTLTPAPTIVYYSNSFKAQYRIQSEDRIHRFGASKERGCKIIDLIHLPTDRLVLNRIKNKKDAMELTLTEIDSVLPD